MNAAIHGDLQHVSRGCLAQSQVPTVEALPWATIRPLRELRILIRPFADRRPQPPETVGRRRNGALVRLIDVAPPTIGSVSSLASELVLRALECVQRRPDIKMLDQQNCTSLHSSPVLEGELHSLWFEEYASTSLVLDLSLTLKSSIDGMPIWAVEIPQDSTCPAWIGIGRTLEQSVVEAFESLVNEFRQIFTDREFAAALAAAADAQQGSGITRELARR